MPENTPPAPGAAPGENTPKTRGPFNKAQLASISKTEQICAIALKDEYLRELISDVPIEEGGITKAWIQDLAARCTTARTTSGQAVGATTGKEDETQAEHARAAALIALLRFVQAQARQKYHSKNSNILTDYGIGTEIGESRATLEAWGQTIYDKTGTDTLPKVDAAKREEIRTTLAEYKTSQTDQTGDQGDATGLRSQRDTDVDALIAGRMKIQFAADGAWPYTKESNHATRMEFQLPASRPFVG